ncbi:hypothetical protein F4859DRAFT_478682 [Xylaria cf. heliscus]|nr:hypothetical protein F4859DRAFT_478682 [Xylaria cf. heliscus]
MSDLMSSPLDPELAAPPSTPQDSTMPDLNETDSDETYETPELFTPLPSELEEIILPEQRRVIKDNILLENLLLALSTATLVSSRFAFEGDYGKVFQAGVTVFYGGDEDEVVGIELRFLKELSFDVKKYVARRLIRGLLIRYPPESFPRTFMVAETDPDRVEKPLVLVINVAGKLAGEVYEKGTKMHDLLVGQWWNDCLKGSKIAKMR